LNTPIAPQKILRLAEVMKCVGLRSTQIDLLVHQGVFPRPIKLSPGGRAIGWLESEIAQYQEARIAERDREKKR
jgi:prophage regulatory protein